MRSISSSWLNGLLRLHLNPIILKPDHSKSDRDSDPVRDVVVSDGPESNLGACFVLRCFQRLSLTHIDTQRRPWQDYWYTRGALTPVLSY